MVSALCRMRALWKQLFLRFSCAFQSHAFADIFYLVWVRNFNVFAVKDLIDSFCDVGSDLYELARRHPGPETEYNRPISKFMDADPGVMLRQHTWVIICDRSQNVFDMVKVGIVVHAEIEIEPAPR